ncbi:hypothetical protein [Streptomyces sp. NPDC048419]|uniref:hypothetical protein n=1 Tax=Streptomyces sp. NPDC048419 TaxID=3365547 RepID=UPI00371C2E68
MTTAQHLRAPAPNDDPPPPGTPTTLAVRKPLPANPRPTTPAVQARATPSFARGEA